MDFWRSGRPRTHREAGSFGKSGSGGGGGIMNRLRHMYFPPWVPVVGIIVVVFGILGGLFLFRSASGAPRIADHWHANYTFDVCGDRQPNAPTWEGVGVHTHGDGIIHIHPFTAGEEGANARLEKWFDYGGGELSDDSIRLPGLSETWENGEVCPEGSPDAGEEGEVQVFVNSRKLDDWGRYIPKDADTVRMIFGPPEEFVQLDDRIVIPEEEGLREIDITVTGTENTTTFDPSGLQVEAGEVVKINLTNESDVSHGLRFAGDDGIFSGDDPAAPSGDDFVVVPVGSDPETADQGDIIEPGGQGFAIVRFDQAGEVPFKDPTATNPDTEEPFATGTVIVGQAGTPTPGPDEVSAEVSVSARPEGFEPPELTVPAGEKFRINITVEGDLGRNIRISGPRRRVRHRRRHRLRPHRRRRNRRTGRHDRRSGRIPLPRRLPSRANRDARSGVSPSPTPSPCAGEGVGIPFNLGSPCPTGEAAEGASLDPRGYRKTRRSLSTVDILKGGAPVAQLDRASDFGSDLDRRQHAKRVSFHAEIASSVMVCTRLVSSRICCERASSSSFWRRSSCTVSHSRSASASRLASVRFCEIITNVLRKIASSETIMVSRPNG